MKRNRLSNDKPVHFGSISIPLAKGLYKNGNLSLILVLLYIDSRKHKSSEQGYEYPFEYNAPDIHFNTGVGLKVINKHLKMLTSRGALEVIKDAIGKLEYTKKGALKYRIVKKTYEQQWGPGSRGGSVLNAGRSEPLVSTEGTEPAGIPTPPDGSAAGGSEPCSGQEGDDETRAPSARQGGDSTAPNALPAGLSGTVLNALRPGLSEPTNDNEIFREEKNAAKKEDNRSGCACASPPPQAPASAAAAPSPRPSGETSNEQELTSGEVSS